MRAIFLVAAVFAGVAFGGSAVRAETAGHVTGFAGIIVKSKDPKALSAWYRDVLGIPMEAWGGAKLSYDAPGHPPMVLWAALPQSSGEMAPSQREFMVNFAVDDLDAFVAKIKGRGVKIVSRDDTDPFGKFANILDPDGTKIELWEPKRK